MLVLAHQGGWDEFLYFTIPVVLGFIGLRHAEKRAKAKAGGAGDEERTGRPSD